MVSIIIRLAFCKISVSFTLFFCYFRRVVDSRAAQSSHACAIRRNPKYLKPRFDYAWLRIDCALIAHFWLRLITPDCALITPDCALITPDCALIAHWSRIDYAWFCLLNWWTNGEDSRRFKVTRLPFKKNSYGEKAVKKRWNSEITVKKRWNYR